MSWTERLHNLFRHNKIEAEAEEEIQFHLVARMEENLAKGMPPAEARREAARCMGGELQAREATRDADLVVWLETLAGDVRYACRNLVGNAGFTIVAALSLALGIGANTAIFSAIHAVVLRPLPYPDPGRLAMVWMDNRRLGLHEDLTSYPNFEDWKQNRVFADMAGFYPTDVVLTSLKEPLRVPAAAVNWNLISVMGVRPMMGRNFAASEDQPEANRVVILSYGLWQRQFGAKTDVLGKTLEINGRPRQIVGVMPAAFAFPSKETAAWVPLALDADDRGSRSSFFLNVIGRLKSGITREQARAEMNSIGARLEAQYPVIKGYGIWVVPLLEQVVGSTREALLVLLVAVAFVLLIACANVANLFLGRGAARGREIAVRAALGAGRVRLVRQLLTESLVLAMLAGALGLGIALAGVRGLILLAPKDLPRVDEITVNGTVLLFTLGVSILAGLLFGVLPALRISSLDLNESLREGGRSLSGGKRSRLIRSGLTVAEVAFSMVLLTGAGLMIHSLLKLQSVKPGFRTENMLTWRISPSRNFLPAGAEGVNAFYAGLLQRIQTIPGVESVGAVSDIFLSETPNSGSFTVEGHPSPPPEQQIEATRDVISTAYFQTMGVRLVRGRFFDAADTARSAPVVIINQTMAQRLWPGEDAVGKRFKFGGPNSTNPWMGVVGIVADMRRQGLQKGARCEAFLPMAQRPRSGMTVVVHAASDPEKLAGAVRDAARGIDPNAVLYQRSTIAGQIGDSLAERRFETLLLGLFSLLALVLAAVGIYGVVFQSVVRRTSEIGIRVALGAQKSGVFRMILGETLTLVGVGVLVGGAAALAVSRALASFLYGVTAADPLTYLAVIALLTLAAGLASVIPARRATTVDPIQALRYE